MTEAKSGFYSLPKAARDQLVFEMYHIISHEFRNKKIQQTAIFFSDEDTYIRKAAYLNIGKIYNNHPDIQDSIIQQLASLLKDPEPKMRQTAVNTAGEIGKIHFEKVIYFFETGLFDEHHSVRNAVIGSIKKMGEKNPGPVLSWAKKYLHHPDKEIRREICHGIELRGRLYPEDILPLLKELQFDTAARVRKTLVHVLGQIAYKKGCLEKVVTHLQTWEDKELVRKAWDEIIDVHHRYRNFSYYTQEEAKNYIKGQMG